MKHYLATVFALMALLLGLFALASWLDVPWLADPAPLLSAGGLIAALVGTGLLVTDVLLPVPSSLVMTAHGAIFGVLPGALLSTVGGVGAALVGFWIGRRGDALMARLVPEKERLRADVLLRRWGVLAIIVSRPVPILAESLAIIAGTSSLSWRRVLLASCAGVVPIALVYSVAGSVAASFASGALVFVAVLAVAGIFWLAGRRIARR